MKPKSSLLGDVTSPSTSRGEGNALFTAQNHFPPLDGLRGIAILLVMAFHFSRGMQPATEADHLYKTVLGAGWVGVDLFFVLSGFLITGILLDNKGAARYYRNFYARRALRIVPVYYGFLIVTLLVIVPFVEWRLTQSPMTSVNSDQLERLLSQQSVFWLFLSNIAAATWGYGWAPLWTGPFWSLAVEEQFYLFWPAVVRKVSVRRLVAIAIGAIIFATCFRIWLDLVADANAMAAYFLTPARLDPLAVGALIAIGVRNPQWQRLAHEAAWPAAVVAAVGIGATAFYRGSLTPGDPWVQMLGFPFLALLFGAVLTASITAASENCLNRILSARGLRSVGKYSYAMYVFHVTVHWAGLYTYARAGIPDILGSRIPGNLLYLGLATCLTYLLGWLSWHAYERWFLNLKRYFPTAKPNVLQGGFTAIRTVGALYSRERVWKR